MLVWGLGPGGRCTLGQDGAPVPDVEDMQPGILKADLVWG